MMSTNSILGSGNQLGKNAFLQLLATQMKNQNPLQPQSNSQFVAQLAQFSSLEQLTNISTVLSGLSTAATQVQTTDQLYSAFNLLGGQVTVTTGSGSLVTGSVSAVNITGGQVNVEVGGQNYPLSSVTSASK